MTTPSRRPVPGSARQPVAKATADRPVDAGEVVEVTVALRRRAPVPTDLVDGPDTIGNPHRGASYGADGRDIDVARTVLADGGLSIGAVDEPSRRMQVSGPASAVAAVFGGTLSSMSSPDPATGRLVEHRHRTGELSVPAELDGVVVAVLGIDDRPQARAHFQVAGTGQRAAAAGVSYTPPQLGQAYSFLSVPTAPGRRWPSSSSVAVTPSPTSTPTSPAWASLSRQSAPSASTERPTLPARTRKAPTARCCSTSKSPAPWPPRLQSSSTSRPTPTAASSTPSPQPCTPPRPPRRSASAGARARTPGPPKPEPPWTRRSSTPRPWASPSASLRATTAAAMQKPTGGPRRLPGLQPTRPGLRRHQPSAQRHRRPDR